MTKTKLLQNCVKNNPFDDIKMWDYQSLFYEFSFPLLLSPLSFLWRHMDNFLHNFAAIWSLSWQLTYLKSCIIESIIKSGLEKVCVSVSILECIINIVGYTFPVWYGPAKRMYNFLDVAPDFHVLWLSDACRWLNQRCPHPLHFYWMNELINKWGPY